MVTELIQRAVSLNEKKQLPTHREQLIQVLLTELSLLPKVSFSIPISADNRIQTIAKLIVVTPKQRKTLTEWSQYIGMSRRSLARLFVKDTGLSFGRWQQQLLLLIAIHLLSEGLSVQQTAWELGYESVTAFITFFKKNMGVPPAKYITSINRSNSESS